ncbi:Hypothetical predicted protein [Pelobates cultripes]|uniref:Thyroxine-binding globulin n=1 Tax=Pelobates cultripes TaxID=61616 RepID=A0AAD1TID6_PELCU|nr:Hypothetical predicted protein [Pelobates cultripes]
MWRQARGTTGSLHGACSDFSDDHSEDAEEEYQAAPALTQRGKPKKTGAETDLGAASGSATYQQIVDVLSLNRADNDQQINEGIQSILEKIRKSTNVTESSIGNAIFLGERIRLLDSFHVIMDKYYKADFERTMFHVPEIAEEQINKYVRKNTDGKITNLVSNLPGSTLMVMVNYILFKGEWKNTFNEEATHEEEFTLINHSKIKVPMMHRQGLYKTFSDKDLDCKVIEIPYKDKVSMIVAVPRLDIHRVGQALTFTSFEKWLDSLASSFVEISLPKFSINEELPDLTKSLQHLGMNDVFTEKADLTRMSPYPKLLVSKAVHQAVLEVNEFGTEASGATAITVATSSLLPFFKVDRPFFVFIYDKKTKSILFMGRVTEPATANRKHHKSVLKNN